jgi:succinate dehydrogenase/fumarate reductase flavoprotein subunit
MTSNRVAQLKGAGRMDLMDAVPAVRGNLAECIAFGRIAGENAAGERLL